MRSGKVVLAVLVAAAALVGASAQAPPTAGHPGDTQLSALDGFGSFDRFFAHRFSLQLVRMATARYHSVSQAIAAGYLPPPPGACIASPFGAMGYHFENQALMRDNVLDPTRPEVLLYERRASGQFSLTGVEYYMEADRVTAAPVLFGQTFHGPMPPHHPGMETHYDLHAWIWKSNPNGTFADWNPTVSCP